MSFHIHWIFQECNKGTIVFFLFNFTKWFTISEKSVNFCQEYNFHLHLQFFILSDLTGIKLALLLYSSSVAMSKHHIETHQFLTCYFPFSPFRVKVYYLLKFYEESISLQDGEGALENSYLKRKKRWLTSSTSIHEDGGFDLWPCSVG